MSRRLPPELLQAIVNDVGESTHDLLQLRSVNRAFHALATPAAFRRVRVTATKDRARALARLLQSHLAPLVQEIVFDSGTELADDSDGSDENSESDASDEDDVSTDDADEEPDTTEDDVERPAPGATVRLLSKAYTHISKASSLTTLTFDFHSQWEEPNSTEVEDPSPYLLLQLALLEAAANSSPSSVKELNIDNFIALPNPFYASRAFQGLLGRLQRFSMSTISDDYTETIIQAAWQDFWRTTVRKHILGPLQRASALTSLTLRNDKSACCIVPLSFADKHFPNLTSFSLGGFHFGDQDVEDFIVRHGATLTDLELSQCTISVSEDEYEYVADGEGGGPNAAERRIYVATSKLRCWAEVWNRLSQELSALVVLDVEEPEELVDDDGGTQIVRYTEAEELWEVVSLRGEDVDAAALQAFKDVVAARRLSGSR
ncbi:hypothetical protein FA95DRAFT_1573134 [Auriscalpium vulgare]|uniref:Uncharacterized protein n=1 Tax=Auriscalpium vulgare TaxID=40419 RepID=A0ACB8RQS2_9AGAM|nr:hypothetical protein FA95DRAFT_1573134 [Auriscalpium vulgare]